VGKRREGGIRKAQEDICSCFFPILSDANKMFPIFISELRTRDSEHTSLKTAIRVVKDFVMKPVFATERMAFFSLLRKHNAQFVPLVPQIIRLAVPSHAFQKNLTRLLIDNGFERFNCPEDS